MIRNYRNRNTHALLQGVVSDSSLVLTISGIVGDVYSIWPKGSHFQLSSKLAGIHKHKEIGIRMFTAALFVLENIKNNCNICYGRMAKQIVPCSELNT